MTDSPGTMIALTVTLLACTLGMLAALATVGMKGIALWRRYGRIRDDLQPRVGGLRKALNGTTVAAYALRGHGADLVERVTPRTTALRDEAARVVAAWKAPAEAGTWEEAMTEISTGWIVVTYACFIISTLCMAAMLGGLFYALRRAERMLALASLVGLPRAYALTDSATQIASRIDRILQRIDSESDAAVVRVEQVLEHVEGALENVEHASERIHHTVQGTSEGIHRVKHSPMTKRSLVGAGALAAAGVARGAYEHVRHGRNGEVKQ